MRDKRRFVQLTTNAWSVFLFGVAAESARRGAVFVERTIQVKATTRSARGKSTRLKIGSSLVQ